MTLRGTLRTAERLLRQLRHDRRTIALVLLAPSLLLTVVYYMYEQHPAVFDRIALIMLEVFPFIIMLLLTSVAMLRERTSGTLERLLTTPVRKLDLLFGYGLAFGLAATLQAVVTTTYAYLVLGMDTAGPAWSVVLIAVCNAVLGMALGLLCSAFARTEFQAVQFMPLVASPQILLCGLFVPREAMAGWLEGLSTLFPLTWSVDALMQVGSTAEITAEVWRDIGIVLGVVALALALGAATLLRRTP